MAQEPQRQQESQSNNVKRIYVRTFYGENRSAGQKAAQEEAQEKMLKSYMNFLKLFPIVFLVMIIGILYVMVLLFQNKISIFLLMGIFSMIFIREVSTLWFSYRMRNNILRPLSHLQKGVEEVAGGNYGYSIDEEVPSSISGLFHSFNKMSHQLKEGQIMKEKYELNRNELIAGISHDLKTPITSIMGYVEGINEGVANTDEKMGMYMEIIYNNARYTNQLIDDLFLFSKLDINQVTYQFTEIGVKYYFEDIFVEKKIDLEEQGHLVTYESTIPEDLVMAIDPKMIYRVASNILGNAIKYNDKDQLKLDIRLEQIEEEPSAIHISVQDNGAGIDEEQLEAIFDVFYRADASRNKDIGGSGLGLSISRQLVEAHGGRIWAESRVGEGTTFHFTLVDQKVDIIE